MARRSEMVVRISPQSVLTVLAILSATRLLAALGTLIALVFVVLVLVATLMPLVNGLLDRGWSRSWAAAVVVISLVLLFAGILALVGRPLVMQAQGFVNEDLPAIVGHLEGWLSSRGLQYQDLFARLLQQVRGDVARVLSVAQWLLEALTVLGGAVFLIFYTLVDGPRLWGMLLRVTPLRWRPLLRDSAARSTERLGAWLRGQLLLSLIVGGLDGLAMWLLGAPSALAVGLLAAVLELVPYVGGRLLAYSRRVGAL